ncbi:zinc finger domain-containing protein [Streptomyces sp. MMS24-I29]|uniref:zinc finger domain-containing protein n=1 Tax=Streptomyces sp. MMS24-I29 TaxID=3351480 RepID=UPI003C7CC85E
MNPREITALIAYAVRLDPRLTVATDAEADERLAQWCDLLADVPATAPHPEGRDWNAAWAVRQHIATSPYRIQPSDISRPWHAFRRDILSRHVDPTPNVDPDDEAAYRAALVTTRHAIETGQAPAQTRTALPTGTRAEREQADADRLAQFGGYRPRLAEYRPVAAERRRLVVAGQPDPYTVPCPWGACRAPAGQRCQTAGRPRTDFHPARIAAARTGAAA